MNISFLYRKSIKWQIHSSQVVDLNKRDYSLGMYIDISLRNALCNIPEAQENYMKPIIRAASSQRHSRQTRYKGGSEMLHTESKPCNCVSRFNLIFHLLDEEPETREVIGLAQALLKIGKSWVRMHFPVSQTFFCSLSRLLSYMMV